jgi:hypothetical protein
MLPTLTLAAALALTPSQGSAKLSLTNLRVTYGLQGPDRKANKYLPGDPVFLAFDIDGITIGKDGKVAYTMGLDVTDKAGKSWHKVDPTERVEFAPLGGSKMPGRAFVTLGVDAPPGEYTVKLTTVDSVTRASASFEHKFEVLKPDLGLIQVYASQDADGRTPAHTTGFVGGSVWVMFAATGFKRSEAKKNQPDLRFEMTTVDDKGVPTMAQPIVADVDKLDDMLPTCPMRFNLPFTRAGKFAARLTVTDKVANKTATFDLPITVLPADK